MEVKVINKSSFSLPHYETPLSAGMDVAANVTESVIIGPGERKLIPSGLFVAVPEGYEIQVRPRSGLALKSGITVLNTPGTIDSDYRGEIGVILINLSGVPFVVEPGMRVAQIVLAAHEKVEWKQVDELNSTTRGAGGFGSTGTGRDKKKCAYPIVFEFCPKTEIKQTVNVNSFHYNWIGRDGKPEHKLFENNYIPIVIFDSEITTTGRFREIHDRLYAIGKSGMKMEDKFRKMYEIAGELEDPDLMETYSDIQAEIDENKKKFL